MQLFPPLGLVLATVEIPWQLSFEIVSNVKKLGFV